MTKSKLLRIGEVAERSGVSAKALRLYERHGLLRPSSHSPSGYRLYGVDALARLMQIVILKRSGFALREIATLLQADAGAATHLLQRRIAALEQEAQRREQVLRQLRLVAGHAAAASSLPIPQLLESISMSTTLDVKFTPAERAEIEARGAQYGAADFQAIQRDWSNLIVEVRTAMGAGTPANHPFVQELARRWHALVQAFTGGNAGVARKVGDAYRADPSAMASQGLDPAMFAYVSQAMRAAGLKPAEQA
jgi:MerR family transcriptional regulator, thiopeptide resistance regulator